LTVEGTPALAIDGTERRRQRPTDAARHQDHSSGTKPAHTDKPIVVSNEHTGQVVSLGPTIPGKTHDKQAGEATAMVSPANATRAKDTGLHGDAPAGVWTAPPQKSREARP